MNMISTPDLIDALQSPTPAVLLHVLPQESWEAQHIPTSRCFCVYETSFLANVVASYPDAATDIVVYGMGLPMLESSVAAEKLRAAGYLNVRNYRDGITGWMQENLPVNGTALIADTPPIEGTWQIDTDQSIIRWTGRNLFNFHHGTLKLSGGYFMIGDNALTQSSFTIDMTSITCDDILDQATNQMLLNHLMNSDFFAADQFPEAIFTAISITAIPQENPGIPNYRVVGDLSMRGVTQPIAFPALIALSDEGTLTAQAQIEIDRTHWGVNYGSGRLFSWLDKHVVNDHVAIHLKIVARRTV
ncbi:MAG: sulfurtransferase [Akkermansiaceae bacterium]|nr:sulfurtransferase [Akkermansiaceae bacterium]